jgi:tryptophan 2,3-dioxygenase
MCIDFIMEQLKMLEQMDPWEYQEIRVVLGHGSGFDSPGFRAVPRVTQRASVAFQKLLAETGMDLPELYQRGREHESLYQLAEALTELDERATVWRVRHFKVVERIIGAGAVGTQGTPVELLGGLIHKRFYPELWDVRNELTETAKQEETWRSRS